jgi:PAS domain S-box-containing protein
MGADRRDELAVGALLDGLAPGDAGPGMTPARPASRSRQLQFFVLVGAIALAFVVHVATMAFTAERKLELQRDGATLSDLMDSWHRLLQVTHQLPYREDRPEAAWKDGVDRFQAFQAKLLAFEQRIDGERLLDAERRQDEASLARGLRYGNQFIQETYDDLERFIGHNRRAGHDSILGSTMYDILRNVGGYSYEENDLLHFSRMYQDVRKLGFSFTNQLEAKQERIQVAIQAEIARLTRLYTWIELALLVFVGLAVALLLLRLVALFRSLQESEALHRTLFTAMAEGVFLLDARGRIAAVNPAAVRLARRPSGELLGAEPIGPGQQTIREDGSPFAPEDQPAALALRVGVARSDVTMGIGHADGSETWVSVNAQPLGSELPPRAVIMTWRDVTERMRADEALRTTEERLRQAQKMEAIGSLAGGVAHDFNNLLSVILGGSALLADELPEGHPGRPVLQEIQVAGERARELTHQLLAFSRKQILQPRVVDLNAVVLRMERMLRRLIGEDVALVVRAAPGLRAVKVDPGQLEQVIMNLVLNSRDAMVDGGTITIETADVQVAADLAERIGALPGPHVMLAIADTGVGMSVETRRRMFEPFFTTKGLGKGTGLGLATVLGIVQQSGGHIQVDSEPGEGTAVRIFFPSTSEPITRDPAPDPVEVRPAGDETILVVEDEEQVRAVLEGILRRAGYQVLTASGGAEALSTFSASSTPIHLLLTDVIMPGMSGPVLAQRLQALRPGLEVLFISGYTNDEIDHHGVLDAGTHFLEKPVTPDALTRKIREVLDGRAR